MATANSAPATDDQPPTRPEYADPVERLDDVLEGPEAPDGPPTDEAVMPELNDPEGELEDLEDRSLPVERVLWAINNQGQRVEQIYVQKGLSWFGKLELYGLLGQAVKVVLEGDNPLGVSSMFDMVNDPRKMLTDMMGSTLPGAETAPDRQDEGEMDVEAGKVLAAFAQVISIAPELLSQAYCVALAIPKTHRNWAVEWAFPNMDDEMGKDILHTFIDQNWGVMEDFFAQELPKIMKRVVKARRQHSDGPR